MRNKLLILSFLVFTVNGLFATGTDSAGQASPKIMKIISVKDIIDHGKSINSIKTTDYKLMPGDTSSRKVVPFEAGFRDKYLNDSDFNYNETADSKSFFNLLLKKIGKFLEKLLGLNQLTKTGEIAWLVVKILSGVVLLVVLYFIVRMLMNHKGEWFLSKKNAPIDIDINDIEQLIQSADFEQLIAGFESRGDIRQSIRLYYLWLLKDLKDKNLIDWHPEKTNADYQNELKDESLKSQFSYLSYLFNYIWYGEFNITDKEYISARNAFLIQLRKTAPNE